MSAPLSKALPPPPPPEVLAQRRKQKRLVLSAFLGILVLAGAWQGWSYYSSAPERAEKLVKAGSLDIGSGKFEQALTQLDAALAIDPNSSNAYFQRAIAKQNLNRLDDAAADYQMVLQLRPDFIEARASLAGLYAEKGDVQRSVNELTKIIEQKPSIDAYSRRAQNYAELGQHENAIQDYTWLIDEMRDAPYAYWGRAKSKRALGDDAGALADEQMAQSFDRKLRGR